MNNTIISFIEQNKYPKEEFKEIENTGGKYYVSSLGRIVSACTEKPQFLDPWFSGNGYLKVSIRISGKRKKVFVHRLVAEAFLQKPETDKRLVVHHKDLLRSRDNSVENLVFMPVDEHTKLHNKIRAQNNGNSGKE